MRVSVEDYSENLANHEAPAGYEITIVDSKGNENKTCLNKDEQGLIVYDRNDVTILMKKIQQLDEKGHLSATHDVGSRKKYLLKMRSRREAYKKNHPEDAVSGVIVADKIAEKVISGSEKRSITPEVAREYKNKISRNL